MIHMILSLCVEDLLLPIAVLVFAWRFPKREMFVLRLPASYAVLTLFQFALVSVIWCLMNASPFLLNALQLHSILLIGEVMLLLWCCFKLDLRNSLLCLTLGYAIQNIASNVSSGFSDPNSIALSITKRVVVFAFVLALGYLLFNRRIRHSQGEPKASLCVLGIVMIILSCIILPSQFFRFDLGADAAQIDAVLRTFNILFCLVISEMEVEMLLAAEEREVSDRLRWMLEQKRDQYENAKATAELIRVKYHDLKHYLSSESSDSGIGASLTQDMKEGIQRYDAQFNTGSSALDIVLTEKAMQCIKKSITFSCMADGAPLHFMRSVDIYALFSNAMDNAIEAVAKCSQEKRVISMNLHQQAGLLSLHLENYCEQEPEWRDGELVSSKKDADWHGYGTKSIRMIVEKYDGTLQMQMTESMFTLDAMFFVKAA